MKYVIRRTDQGGGYVAPPGQDKSYVRDLRRARTFDSREAAEAERCPENEVIEEFAPERSESWLQP